VQQVKLGTSPLCGQIGLPRQALEATAPHESRVQRSMVNDTIERIELGMIVEYITLIPGLSGLISLHETTRPPYPVIPRIDEDNAPMI
jgi:hypothetical protein